MTASSTFTFRISEPGQEAREVPVKDGLTLGRHPGSGVVLQDPKTSGNHAKVVTVDGYLMIEDAGSTNKTRVENGPTLSKGERFSLIPGIKLFLGSTTIEVIGPAVAEGPLMTVLGTIIEEGPKPAPKPPAAQAPVASSPPPAAPKPAPAAPAEPVAEKPTPAPSATPPASGEPAKPAPPKPAAAPAAHGHGHAEAKKPAGIQYGEINLGNVGGTIVGKNVQLDSLAKEAAFRAARPRFVMVNEAQREIVALDNFDFVIGRVANPDPNAKTHCVVPHGSLSSIHAKVSFNGRSFFIEDLGSKNGTFLGKEMLAAKSAREIRPESLLRLGSVDFLFVVDSDAEGKAVPPAKYQAALDLLISENKITKLQRMKAEQDAREQKRHAGEMLLLAGTISVETWLDALDRSVLVEAAQKVSKGSNASRIAIIIALIGLAGAVYYLWSQLKSSGR